MTMQYARNQSEPSLYPMREDARQDVFEVVGIYHAYVGRADAMHEFHELGTTEFAVDIFDRLRLCVCG